MAPGKVQLEHFCRESEDYKIWEEWATWEGDATFPTNSMRKGRRHWSYFGKFATGRYAAYLCYFHGGAKYMCQCCSPWRRQVSQGKTRLYSSKLSPV